MWKIILIIHVNYNDIFLYSNEDIKNRLTDENYELLCVFREGYKLENNYELVSSGTVNKSMIRKIGENQYLKIIPTEKIIQISTIKQEKITEPIEQSDKTIIKAYPKEVKLYKNQNQDNKYTTTWESYDGETFDIPSADIKTIYSLLQAKHLVVVDNMLHLSNVLSMIIKQGTLEKKIANIKDEI